MKKIVLFVASLLIAVGANAQNWSIGVKGGLSIPDLSSSGSQTELSKGYTSRQAGEGGIFAEYQFSKLFSLQAGLEYSGQGGKKDGMQALPSSRFFGQIAAQTPAAGVPMVNALGQVMPKYLYYDVKSNVKFDYLMLPVTAKFGWNLGQTSPFRVYVGVGLFASYLMHAERNQTGTSGVFANASSQSLVDYYNALPTASQPFPATNDPTNQPAYTYYQTALGILTAAGAPGDKTNTQNITDDIYRFNVGFIGNVGISYAIDTRNKVFIEGGGNYGFKNIQKNPENGKNRIGAGTVMLGYAYTFGK